MSGGPAPWLQTHWDWRAAGNFIAGGSGSGLLLACAAFSLLQPVPAIAIAIGLGLILGGLGLVWLELGKPWRFLHVFFHPQTSWMTREASVALPLTLTGLASLWFGGPLLLWLCGLLGGLFLYCQGRILHAARGIPAWRERRMVALIVATGLVEGVGALALIDGANGSRGAILPLTLALVVTLGLRAGLWFQYRRRLLLQGAPSASLRALDRFEPWFLLLGHALPLALLLPTLLPGEINRIWPAGTGLLAMLAGWMLKFVLIRRAAYNQGYAIVHTAARGGGKSGPGCQPGWQ